jgi:hypothetical protein
MMKRTISFAAGCLFLGLLPASAVLDIVADNAEGKEPVYVLQDTSTGENYGTFWDRANDTSDFGFESSIVPDFVWSKDRDYVAVTAGASRSRTVSIYKVVGSSLEEVSVPQLNDEQAAPLSDISNPAAEGMDAIRWQPDGTLLVRFWSVDRVADDSAEQKEANVWADIEIDGNRAITVGTSTAEPSAPSEPSLTANPAPPAGETLASRSEPIYAQGDTGEQPPDNSDSVFRFDGKDYFLRGDQAGIREYLTEGETFESWNTLISIRHFDGTDDPRAYAFAIVKNAKASDPKAQGQVMENDAAGSYIADFLVYSEEGSEPAYAEWNLWRVEKKGDGVEAVQYARRFYNFDAGTPQQLIADRERIVPELAVLEIPAE